ncbi:MULTISPECIES: RNA polymerase sigma factor [Sphingobacterium]|uniref:RNA polymerase sigma factor n=1 Tax=Sphingobacterium TaxID=28453 RepID=UPI001F08B0E5|nr:MULTISPECIES: sigma-70 family RNA polymerase sigma factor [unclassified Sphingobacterium]
MKLTITGMQDERELLKAISKGNHDGFERLFLHYYRALGNYIYRLLEDQDSTADLVQEVFLGLWVERERLADVESFKDYLFIITRNRIYNQLKLKAKDSLMFESLEMHLTQLTERSEQSDDPKERERYFKLLEEEIEKLPLQQQRVFKLAKMKKMKYEQIAQFLDLSVETVRKHMYLAQRTLRNQLKGKEGGILLLILSSIYFTKF